MHQSTTAAAWAGLDCTDAHQKLSRNSQIKARQPPITARVERISFVFGSASYSTISTSSTHTAPQANTSIEGFFFRAAR